MKKFNTRDSFIDRIRILCVIVLMVSLAACSSIRFTYNHGDTLLYWWMNTYIDLDSDQSTEVRQDINELFQWHRKTQLRDYAQLLARARVQLAGSPTADDLQADYREIKARSELLAFKALPELADLARSMKPEQIARMEKKFASNNDTFRKKFMRGDLDKQRKVRFEKSMEQFELWFGNFSSDQEAVLRKASDARPLDNQIWLDERMRRQQRIAGVLRKIQQEKLSKDAAMAQLHALIKELFERLDGGEHKAFYEANTKGTIDMILTAIRIATPAQKAHAQKRMQGWIDDFNTLAADTK